MRFRRVRPMTDPLVARLAPRDYREVARYVIGTPTYEWIRSGSGDGFEGDNEAAFRRRRLRARRPRRRVRGQHRDDRARRLDRCAGDDRPDGPPAGGPPGWRARDGRRSRAGRQPARRGRQRDHEHRGHRRRPAGPAALVPALQLGRSGCAGRRHRPGRSRRRARPSCRWSTRRSTSTTPRRRSVSGCRRRRQVRPLRHLAREHRHEHLGVPRPGSARSPPCRSCPRGS